MLMTAYLKWQGLTEAKLSLYRGAGAVSGLAAIDIVPRVPSGISAAVCKGVQLMSIEDRTVNAACYALSSLAA